jgi:hypothetical protein
MGFFKRLFGSDEPKKKPPAKPGPGGYVDTQGIYIYVRCDNCGTPVRLRIDKQYDLLSEGGGHTWHKTIVDSRCFRPMPAVVHFNADYEVTEAQVSGGTLISEETYEAIYAEREAAKAAAAARPPSAPVEDEAP